MSQEWEDVGPGLALNASKTPQEMLQCETSLPGVHLEVKAGADQFPLQEFRLEPVECGYCL